MFSGFGPETLTFLKGLDAHNAKPWFDAHRSDYEEHYLGPARDFIEAVAPALRQIAPDIHAEPRVNGSIFRINRDIRFSKDKTPYKPHLDLWFWEGARKAPVSGFFFRLTPKRVILGAGAHVFPPAPLQRWREITGDRTAREEMAETIEALRIAGLPLRGEALKSLPRGFEARNSLHATLLRHKAVWVDRDTLVPRGLGTPGFADQCVDLWTRAAPLHHWLVKWLGQARMAPTRATSPSSPVSGAARP